MCAEQCSHFSAPLGLKAFATIVLVSLGLEPAKQTKTEDRRDETLPESGVLQSFSFVFLCSDVTWNPPDTISPVFVISCGHHLTSLCPMHKSWYKLKATLLLCFSSLSLCDRPWTPSFSSPVVYALDPAESFLRSLIASLRLSICLSTLLNCILLNLSQKKTDGLIYPDVLLWAFRRAVRAAVLKGVLQSKWEAVKQFQARRWLWVP